MAKGPFIVAYGDEDYLLDREALSARSQKNRLITCLDGNKLKDTDVVNACDELSYDGSDRIVVLDNAQKVKGDKSLISYVESKDPKDRSSVLVAIVRAQKLPALWSKVGKYGVVLEHKRLAPWEESKAISRIETEAKTLGVRLGEGVPELIIRGTGFDLGRHVGELRKLSFVTKGIVQKTDVQRILLSTISAEPYQVAEAAASKDSRRAMRLLSLVYRHMGDATHITVSSALIRQTEKLITVRYLLDHGADLRSIASRLDMHQFRLQRTLIPQANKHSFQSLLRYMDQLCLLDETVKGPARSKRTHVELAVLSIAT